MHSISSSAALTQGPVGPTLLRMAGPMFIGHLAIVAFNLTDTYFIAGLGTESLAAMSYTLPVVMLLYGITFGVGIGTSAVISRAIGQGDTTQVQRLTTDCLYLMLILGAVIAGVGLVYLEPMLAFMGATGEPLRQAYVYMFLWMATYPINALPMVANNAIRATGDTRTPGMIMVIAALINGLLDPFLIYGWWIFPSLGILGAAIATVLARFLSTLASLWFLQRKLRMTDWSWPGWKPIAHSWGRILWIGLPAMATHLLMPISAGLFTRIAAGFGAAAVAAVGAGSRIDMFAMLAVISLSSVALPFVGQNFGAGHWDRIRAGRRFSHKFALAWGAVMAVLFWFAAPRLAGVFTEDPEVLRLLTLYLRIIPLGYGVLGINMLACNELNGIHHPLQSTLLNAIRTVLIFVPLAWLGGRWFGVWGILAGATAANFLAGAISELMLQYTFQRTDPGRAAPTESGTLLGDAAATS